MVVGPNGEGMVLAEQVRVSVANV